MDGTAKVLGVVLLEHRRFSEVKLIESFAQTVQVFFGISVDSCIVLSAQEFLKQVTGEVFVSVSDQSCDVKIDLSDKLGLVFCQDVINFKGLRRIGQILQQPFYA